MDKRQGLGVQTGDQLPAPALSRMTAEGEVKVISQEPGKEEGGPEREHLSRSREGEEPRQGLKPQWEQKWFTGSRGVAKDQGKVSS